MREEWAIQAIQKKWLKISRFKELNDPFELSCINLRDKNMRNFNIKSIDVLNNTYGVISFSEDYKSPLMWSHYADDHKGICLGFDVDENDLIKVRYRKDRVKLDDKDRLTKKDALDIFAVKFNGWSYEKERRIIPALINSHRSNGKYFELFSEKMRLTEVLIGVKCNQTKEYFQGLTRDFDENFPPVRVHKLSLAVTKFGITKTIHKV